MHQFFKASLFNSNFRIQFQIMYVKYFLFFQDNVMILQIDKVKYNIFNKW